MTPPNLYYLFSAGPVLVFESKKGPFFPAKYYWKYVGEPNYVGPFDNLDQVTKNYQTPLFKAKELVLIDPSKIIRADFKLKKRI